MAVTPEELERVVEQFRAELMRMYLAREVGKIECDCGTDKWVVRSLPIRHNEPVILARRNSRSVTVIR